MGRERVLAKLAVRNVPFDVLINTRPVDGQPSPVLRPRNALMGFMESLKNRGAECRGDEKATAIDKKVVIHTEVPP